MSRSRRFCLNLPTEAKVWLLKVGKKCWEVGRGRRQNWVRALYFIWQFEDYSWSSVGERALPRFLLFQSNLIFPIIPPSSKIFWLVLPIKCFSLPKQSLLFFSLNGFLLCNLCSSSPSSSLSVLSTLHWAASSCCQPHLHFKGAVYCQHAWSSLWFIEKGPEKWPNLKINVPYLRHLKCLI